MIARIFPRLASMLTEVACAAEGIEPAGDASRAA
jgi:hypothetical protein